jgi:hypothetical protein
MCADRAVERFIPAIAKWNVILRAKGDNDERKPRVQQ